jgi:hypothetical protein
VTPLLVEREKRGADLSTGAGGGGHGSAVERTLNRA